MLDFKILVFYLYYHNYVYKTPQYFLKCWPRTRGDNRHVIPPISNHRGDTQWCSRK